jgi:hypothetical protein
MSITLTVTGTDALKAALANLGEKAKPQVAAALYQEAEEIMRVAKERYVPVDHGVLRNSGFVQQPTIDGDDISVTLGFGGVAKAYAIAIHEHPSGSSPRSWRIAEAAGRPVNFSPSGAGPKYLERPLLEAAKNLVAHLGDRLRAMFR